MSLLKTKNDENPDKNVLRQQFHTDWESVSEEEESTIGAKFFFVHTISNNQSILTKDYVNKELVIEYRLGLDQMFVGKDSLVHAGSELEGLRLHGVFVPDSEIELNSKEEKIHFATDDNYPNYN